VRASRLKPPFARPLWNHAAFEHFVGDRSSYSVEKRSAQLRVRPQYLYEFFFTHRLRLALSLCPFLPQLLAAGILVFLDDPVSDPVHERVLSKGHSRVKEHKYNY
jgi:hypothetical protein